MTRPRHPTSRTFLNDDELQAIVEKYFNHINGVEHLMPNFPKPAPMAYPVPMHQNDVTFPKKNVDFWRRVEEQRLAGLQRQATGVYTKPEEKRPPGAVAVGHLDIVDDDHWWQKDPLCAVLIVTVILTALFFPEILEVIGRTQ